MKKINQLLMFAVAVCVMAISVSCNDDSVQPNLPPVSSFEMDFSSFVQEKSTDAFIGNWAYSALVVSVFNTYASTSIAVPAAAYKIALTHTPEYTGKDVWLWDYSFPVLGATFNAKLTGQAKRAGKVKWEMRIDKLGPNGFTDFLWFEGETEDQEKANWTIYENPVSPAEVLAINWEKGKSNEDGSLKYKVIKKGDTFLNSSIEAGRNTSETYDRFYNVFRSDENTNINIEWSSANRYGRVKSPSHFNDTNWHCWNQYLLDDFCK
jgi:hypothetical protein